MYHEKVHASCQDEFLNVTLKRHCKNCYHSGALVLGAHFCIKYCVIPHFLHLFSRKSAIKDLESDAITKTNKQNSKLIPNLRDETQRFGEKLSNGGGGILTI